MSSSSVRTTHQDISVSSASHLPSISGMEGADPEKQNALSGAEHEEGSVPVVCGLGIS